MTQGMLVVLGEKNIKKLKDFAELSSDELIGGYDEIKGKRIKINGYLEDFALSREEADGLIMGARKIVLLTNLWRKIKIKKKHLQYLEVIQKKHYPETGKNLRQKYSMFTRKNQR